MKSTLTLFEIASEFRAMEAQLRDLDLDEATIADTMEGQAGDLIDKLAAYVAIGMSMKAEAEAIEAYVIAKTARRIAALRARGDRLLQTALDTMVATNQLLIDQTDLKFRVRDNPESVVIDAEDKVDPLFITEKTVKSIDKAGIKAALKRGETIPWAHLQRTKRLEIM